MNKPLEKEIMLILWKLKKAFPKEIMEHLSKPPPPYNTVLSTVRKLEKNQFVSHTKFGKTHQYYPILSKVEYGRRIFSNLFHGLLGGSKETMLSYFLEEEDIDYTELEAIIEQMKKEKHD